MKNNEVVELIEKSKIIVIIRGEEYDKLEKTVAAIYSGGIRCCELPYDSTGKIADEITAENISKLVKKFPDMAIGGGTVLKKSQVVLTAKAGGKFVVSPDLNTAIVKLTKRKNLISIPGALTPSEATLANRAGADFVKLFPNGEMKESYLKALKLPLAHIKFIAFGGVYPDNIAQVLKAGATGVGVASGIVGKECVEKGDYETIAKKAREYVKMIENA